MPASLEMNREALIASAHIPADLFILYDRPYPAD